MDYTAPVGFTLEAHIDTITVKGKGGEQTVKFTPRLVKVKQKGEGIEIVPAQKETRKLRAAMLSVIKHIKNACEGLTTPYQANLEVVYSHFPISVELKGAEVHIKNFLGEKMPRKAKVKGAAKIEVKGQNITVTGHNKEDVGQTAANIVQATRIVKRDVRVFQDGIYKA